MAGFKHNRSVSNDFAVFLNTFLIISTVIVFAVLVFISYSSMYNNYLDEAMVESTDICADVMLDYNRIMNAYGDYNEEERDRLINGYLDSFYISSKGSLYLVDSDGTVLYTNSSDYPSGVTADDIVLDAIASGDELHQSVKEISGTLSRLVTSSRIGNRDCFCVLVTEVDFTNVISNFMTTLVYPVIVSLTAAIALFVIFTTITIRPIRAISRTISKVSDGDLSARIEDKYTNHGDHTGMLTISSDLTDMAEDINAMIESLENQEKDRAIFVSSVAHDIRTPLTSINGFVTAMTDGTIPPELYNKYLEKIKYEVNRIRTLVVSMTEASSLSHVDPALMEEFDLKNVVDDLVSELEPQLNSKNITCKVNIDETGGTMVYGEVYQLSRVISNIVSNAIKFTPQDGTIIISSKMNTAGKSRLITVEDSGPGVEPDKRNKVFESFYKVDPSRKQEGFGLGLYICKQILAGHGQLIKLEESPSLGGAMFVFTFPLPPQHDN